MGVWSDLLGSEPLLSKSGDKVAPDSLVKSKVVGLYFSAHWCPPCRGFTPKLADYYKADLKKKGMEIVFVSSDKDEDAFQKYCEEMPWLALSFGQRDIKTELSKKFKIQGIPAFIVLDGATGKLITTEGRARVTEDPKGEDLPWTPKTLPELLDGDIVDKDGKLSPMKDLAGKKLGIYFSAHWCPPCRNFTPKLAAVYKKLVSDHKEKFEVIFASSDKNEEEFKSYLGEMPWKAIPFSDRKRKEGLSSHFDVDGIPTLVILDENRKVLNKSAVGKVHSDPEGASFPWIPDVVKEVDRDADGIDEVRSVIVLQEEVDESVQKKHIENVQKVATKYRDATPNGDDPEFIFFTASKKGQLASRVRDECGGNKEKFAVVCMDIPDNGKYYTSALKENFTVSDIEGFLDDIKNGKCEKKQMGGE